MAHFAFVFPGQGSQALNMMDGLADFAVVKETFAEAATTLGVDFWAMLHETTADNINQTLNTQPLLLTASYATYRAWLEKSGARQPNYVAGHSLGEYSALVASGVLEFTDALKIVRKRAEFMQEAVKPGAGAMAAVLGLADELVVAECGQVMENGFGIVQGVNFNSPGQIVIAGETAAVAEATTRLKAAGARKVLPLPVSVPSHCALMKPAASQLAQVLEQITFKTPQIPLIQNVNAMITSDVAVIKAGLVAQLYSPVLWAKTITTLATQQVPIIVECGPGKVLSGLNKRIYETANLFNLQTTTDLETLLHALN